VSCFLLCRVELRTQEAERGANSEEAERLVWAAQTIFATGCECLQLSHCPAVAQLSSIPQSCSHLFLALYLTCSAHQSDVCFLLYGAAEKASIYTYPGAVLPVLNPLMRVLAYYFPDKGIKAVSLCSCHLSSIPLS
jgi:hypothetical protein